MPSFNSDHYIYEEVIKLKKKFNIETFIETGTFNAETTREMMNNFVKVYTIESDEKMWRSANHTFRNNDNVECLLGSSPEVLDKILVNIKEPIFFYLDAHAITPEDNNYGPLLDELKVIGKYKLKNSLIAIHDFKVPNKDFGYGIFPDGSPFEWEAIEPYIRKIYDNNFRKYYNDKAVGAYRGIIYITPGDKQ